MLGGDARDVWPATTRVLREFPAASVRLVSELFVGRYGPVYYAELLTDPAAALGSRVCRPVAAKTLSATASPDTVNWSIDRLANYGAARLSFRCTIAIIISDQSIRCVHSALPIGDLNRLLLFGFCKWLLYCGSDLECACSEVSVSTPLDECNSKFYPSILGWIGFWIA